MFWGMKGAQNGRVTSFLWLPCFHHPVSWPSSARTSVIHPLWRVSWCLLRGEGRVPGFIGWGRGLRGPTAPYTTSSVSAPGASSRYLLPAGLKELSGALWCKSWAFLLAPCWQPWIRVSSLLGLLLLVISCLPAQHLLPALSFLALMCLQHVCDHLYRDGWMKRKISTCANLTWLYQNFSFLEFIHLLSIPEQSCVLFYVTVVFWTMWGPFPWGRKGSPWLKNAI